MTGIIIRSASRNWKLSFASCMVVVFAGSLAAQSTEVARSAGTEEEIRLLRAELVALRTEVNSLKEELHRNATPAVRTSNTGAHEPQSAGPDLAPIHEASATSASNNASRSNAGGTSDGGAQESDLAETVSLLQSQVAELAQTKTESSSKMPVKIYGTILSNTFFNTRDVAWAAVPI